MVDKGGTGKEGTRKQEQSQIISRKSLGISPAAAAAAALGYSQRKEMPSPKMNRNRGRAASVNVRVSVSASVNIYAMCVCAGVPVFEVSCAYPFRCAAERNMRG